MKYAQLVLIFLFLYSAQFLSAQSDGKVYEISITTTDKDGKTKVKDFIIEGEDMSQEDIDVLVREQTNGLESDVVVDVRQAGEQRDQETMKITKILKQRANLGDEYKTILEEQDMDIEVLNDKIYINGEEVEEGEFGDTKVRILKFEKGDDSELKKILEDENIEIEENETVYLIEKEVNNAGVAFLGVTVGRSVGDGVHIGNVVKGTSAEEMGLQIGDKLLSINGKEVNGYSSLSKTIKAYLPGELVKVVYSRDDEMMDAMVRLSDYKVHGNNNRPRGSRRYDGNSHRGKRQKYDPNKPVLGVQVSQKEDGIFVDKITVGGAAERAGMQNGDQIVSVNKVEMLSLEQFLDAVKANTPGEEIKLKLNRDGKKKNLKATLQSMKDVVGQRYPDNTSQRIERIVIRDKQENNTERITMKFNEFSLSPNPSPGIVKVDFSMEELKGESLVMRIISFDGKVVRENKVNNFAGQYIKNYDLSDIGAGIYLFQVEKDDQKFTKRFVIEKK